MSDRVRAEGEGWVDAILMDASGSKMIRSGFSKKHLIHWLHSGCEAIFK